MRCGLDRLVRLRKRASRTREPLVRTEKSRITCGKRGFKGAASAIGIGGEFDGSLERTCQTTFLEP
jgi:hypothetical protein